MEKNIYEIIKYIGDNPDREGLKETPLRVVKSYAELFSGYNKDPKELFKVFDSAGYDQMVTVKNIELYSTCEHHILPFIGKCHIGYIPNKKVIGISKLPRIMEIFARRLQLQERLTQQIANCIDELLQPGGVGVVIEAEHLCIRMRGVNKQNATMVTTALKGSFMDNDKTRLEFMEAIGR